MVVLAALVSPFLTAVLAAGAQEPAAPAETAAARREAALASEREQHAAAREKLGDEWSAFETKRLLVLTHVEEKKARPVAEHVEAVLARLEEELGFLGPEEYVRRPILRVHRDAVERRLLARQRSSSTWLPGSLEILASPDMVVVGSYELGSLNWALLLHDLRERAGETYIAMPPWILQGLNASFEGLRLDKRGELEFQVNGWDRDELRLQRQSGRGLPPSELLRMTEDKLGDDDTSGKYVQTDALVRYLFSEESEKSPLTKDLSTSYLGTLKEIVSEKLEAIRARAEELKVEGAKEATKEDPSADAPPPDAPPLDPEEEMARWRRAAWLDAEEEVIEDLWFRSFRSFDEKDWKNFEKSFAKFID